MSWLTCGQSLQPRMKIFHIMQTFMEYFSITNNALQCRSLSVIKRHSSNLDNYEEGQLCVYVHCQNFCHLNQFFHFTEQQRNVKKIRSYPSPSSFALLSNLIDYQIKDKQLLIHRPPECVGPPVQVYHNVFSQFLHDYRNEDLKMGREHYQWTLDIIHGIII